MSGMWMGVVGAGRNVGRVIFLKKKEQNWFMREYRNTLQGRCWSRGKERMGKGEVD